MLTYDLVTSAITVEKYWDFEDLVSDAKKTPLTTLADAKTSVHEVLKSAILSHAI